MKSRSGGARLAHADAGSVPRADAHSQKIEVTRSRAYKKNDQAFVEQKNGAVVRRLIGYGRFEGIETARVLVRLYAASRLHTNFFQLCYRWRASPRPN